MIALKIICLYQVIIEDIKLKPIYHPFRAIALETIKCNVKVSKNTSYLLDILIANYFQLNSKASGVELEKKILSLSDYFLNMLRHTVYRHSAKNKPKWIFSNAIALREGLLIND